MPDDAACWLMKTEPDVYSIDDLARDGVTPWEGVRNYQARNFMRDSMRVGDRVLFYHSATKIPGVAGLGKVKRIGLPDPSAWDPASPYFDPRSTPDDPVWMMVEVAFAEKFPRLVGLAEIKADAELSGMLVCRRGMRLSIQPVEVDHFERVVRLGRGGPV